MTDFEDPAATAASTPKAKRTRALSGAAPVREEPWLRDSDFQQYVLHSTLTPAEVELKQFVTNQQLGFWFVSDVDMQHDYHSWRQLPDAWRHMIIRVLAFFAGADGRVMANAQQNFSDDFRHMLVRSFYAHQASNEAVHAETYKVQIQTLLQDDPVLMDEVLRCERFESIRRKQTFMDRYMQQKDFHFTPTQPRERHANYIHHLQRRLVAFMVVEGVFFSSSFAIIQWVKEQNMLPGVCRANDMILRDENMHCEFAICVYRHMANKLGWRTVREILLSGYEAEKAFVEEALPEALPGLNRELMLGHVQYVVNRLFRKLVPEEEHRGLLFDGAYETTLPFTTKQTSMTKYNNFEHRNMGYTHVAMYGGAAQSQHAALDPMDF